MKYFLALMAIFASTCCWCQELNLPNIQTDYLQAIKQAREQDKSLLYLFVNEEESISSKKFTDNLINFPEFQNLSNNYIVLKVDCSDSVDPESDTALFCKRLGNIYNPDNKFPAVQVTDKAQRPVGDLLSDFSKENVFEFMKVLKRN